MTEELQGFTWIDTTVLVVYMIAVLLGGIYFSKKEMQGKEFFKSDGTVPWWVTCVSIFATLLSPISFLALPGNSYGGTWMLWFAQIGMIIAIPLTRAALQLPWFTCLRRIDVRALPAGPYVDRYVLTMLSLS